MALPINDKGAFKIRKEKAYNPTMLFEKQNSSKKEMPLLRMESNSTCDVLTTACVLCFIKFHFISFTDTNSISFLLLVNVL